jgi:hypothetical protein
LIDSAVASLQTAAKDLRQAASRWFDKDPRS